MGIKKKSCNVSLYMSLVIVLLVFCITMLLSCSSYAITDDEFIDYCNYIKDEYTEKNISVNDINFYINNVTSLSSTLQNYDSILYYIISVNYQLGYLQFVLYNSNTAYLYLNSDNTSILINKTTSPAEYNVIGIVGNPSRISNLHYTIGNYSGSISSIINDGRPYYSTTDVYEYNSQYVSNLIDYINLVPPANIELISSSNHKYGFNDKNQCRAYLTGYDISDITFYVDRYINNDWEQFTNASEYYRLLESDDPYYIYWTNMNYFPVGTYRYRAVYDYDNQFISDSFTITNMIIDNDGIYSNGNISIDTGNTVDNLKDFMGSPADISDLEINSDTIHEAIGLQNEVNPYDNFVNTFFTGLSGALTTVTPQQFKYQVHDWGPIRNVSVANITPQYSYGMASFLSTVSSLVVVFVIVKWVTSIIESLNSADVSRTLEFVEEKYSDLF